LSALGTAHACSAPTNGDVETPAPLPYELELADGGPALAVAPVVAAAFDETVWGATGVSTGTFAVALELDVVDAPVVALETVEAGAE